MKKKNYYAKRNIYRVMSWTETDNDFKFEQLEHYFKMWLRRNK